jgi:hypothetical protein
MGKGQGPTLDELKFIYGLFANGASEQDVINKYDELKKHGKLESLRYRQDIRFIRQRRKEFEAARRILEEEIKQRQDPVMREAKRLHFADLVRLSSEIATELPLPLTMNDYPDGVIDDTGKEIALVSFRNSKVSWQANAKGLVELQAEYKSPNLFNSLITHLDIEFPGFMKRFEDWRKDCSWLVGWNRPKRQLNLNDDPFEIDPIESRKNRTRGELFQRETNYLVNIFDLVAHRRTFEGKCKICEKWYGVPIS